jgi:hypothetical protein
MAHRNALTAALSALALSLLFLLTGCDFDSSYAGGSSVSEAGTSSLDPDAFYTASVGGSVGDGPIVGATIKVFSISGDLLPTATSSDNTADYNFSIRTQGRNYPLTIVAEGGTDIVTWRAPDFKLVTTVMKPGNGQTANLNPYTTLIVLAAQHAGGINEENIAKATEAVVSRYGFGLDPALMPDPMRTPMNESNVHLIVKASETMGEMIRRTRDALMAVNFEVEGVDGKLRVIDGDGVVKALAADLVDGWVDGRGAQGYDRRIAAVANVASAAVMVEAMANRLHVYNVDSTMYMENAIRQVRPNSPASSSTRNVSIPAEALDQSLRSLRAAKVVKNDPRIAEIYDLVAAAKPGTTEFDALSSGIQTMSSGFHNPLNDAVLATALLSEETKLDKINSPEGTGMDSGGDSNTDDTETGDTGNQDSDNTAIEEPIQEEGEPTEDSSGAPTVDPPAESGDKKTYDETGPEDEGNIDKTPVALWSNDGWLQFDGGEGSVLNTGLSLTDLSYGSFTVEAMVQYTGTSSRTWAPIFGASHGPSYSGSESFFIGKERHDDRLNINIGGLAYFIRSSGGLFDGKERHLALVFDDVADEIRIFVDQVLIDRRTGVTGLLTTTSDLLIAGVGHTTDERWVGWIGPHRITKQALKSEEFLGTDGEPVAPRPNRAPTISGTPQTALVAHNPWSFKPTASDTDGDKLTFSIERQPEWASFNTQTGEISGTPGAKGTHPDIVITASDGRAETSLSAFTLQVDEPTLGTATVSWEPPTTRTDGSALTDLAGYRVYYGKDRTSLTHVVPITEVGQTRQFIGNLDTGTWYFAVTAICSQGLESLKSEIGSKTIM